MGKIYDCIIESFDDENNHYIGRIYAYAPDDIDGAVIIPIKEFSQKLEISSIVKVKIIDVDFYDIVGEVI